MEMKEKLRRKARRKGIASRSKSALQVIKGNKICAPLSVERGSASCRCRGQHFSTLLPHHLPLLTICCVRYRAGTSI
jgi:hypothetical protein